MVKELLKTTLDGLCNDASFDVLTPPNEEMGDFSTNLPFILAKKENRNPADIGKELVGKLFNNKELKKYFDKIVFAPPGFINFYFASDFLREELSEIFKLGDTFGSGEKKNTKINLEFVSANPTGPPTVGNARAASYGDTLGNIFKKYGYEVVKEYYVNDVGVQVEKLTKSIINADLKNRGLDPIYKDEDLYEGAYISDSAEEVAKSAGENLNEAGFDKVRKTTIEYHVKLAEEVMNNMGVRFDQWFYESELHKKGEVTEALKRIEKSGQTERKDGALWFKFDEGEAVLIKSDGSTTYLMNDIAYSLNKIEKRKFDKAINILGTDHHGDVPRLLAGLKVFGHGGKLEILLHQLVMLKQKDERLKISKRAGNLVLLEDLIKDVGKDAVRFFFLAKDLNTHMEFDVDLAKEQSNKNPVYYIQYAYARLNSIFEKLGTSGDLTGSDKCDLTLLKQSEELRLMRKMIKFSDLITDIAKNYQVHHLAQYAYELASDFHNFYEKHRVIEDDKNIQSARLLLSKAVFSVLGSALSLMGLNTPKKM